MRNTFLRRKLGVIFLLFGTACSSATDQQTPITSTSEDFCQRSCDKAHACNDATNPAECRSSCRSALATAPELRTDFLGYVASCIEDSNCVGTSRAKCTSEAQAQLSPSKYGQTFCAAFVAAGSQCDSTGATYPESTCFEAAKTYDDSALQAANDCLSQACTSLAACLARTIPDVMLPP
ncbi:MAG TPA: hypothetical protein VER11_05935 [Polyangiaceae bacterium]|nr:hypothetical protein [Polyangiaceae bacterium]